MVGMRLPGLSRRGHTPAREDWLATADRYARALTETGSRCHLNDGTPRFCSWEAKELPATEPDREATTMVGVRCTIHPGGRFLDSTARLDPEDFA